MPEQQNNGNDSYIPDIPENWEAGVHTGSETHYTRDYYLVNDDGYPVAEIRATWDEGHGHSVRVDSNTRVNEIGDIADRVHRASFTLDTKREAMKKVEALMRTYDLDLVGEIEYEVEITVTLEKTELETRTTNDIDRARVLDELVDSEDFNIRVDMP